MLGAGGMAFEEHSGNEAISGDLGGAWQKRDAPGSESGGTGLSSPDAFSADPFSLDESSA